MTFLIEWHSRGRGFDPHTLHQIKPRQIGVFLFKNAHLCRFLRFLIRNHSDAYWVHRAKKADTEWTHDSRLKERGGVPEGHTLAHPAPLFSHCICPRNFLASVRGRGQPSGSSGSARRSPEYAGSGCRPVNEGCGYLEKFAQGSVPER